ncbi:MAG TPA: HD domain-containing phosphohydrolase [Isosphaeraceae bacterium]|jgi:PAS domain S-box-containing protein|nr:HD domain-containing phosphohydrolase [Isosphaeraceae bacterium]
MAQHLRNGNARPWRGRATATRRAAAAIPAALLDLAGEPMALLDPALIVRAANPAFRAAFGRGVEVVGLPVGELGDDALGDPALRRALRAALAEGEEVDERLGPRGGPARRLRARRVVDADGRPAVLVAVAGAAQATPTPAPEAIGRAAEPGSPGHLALVASRTDNAVVITDALGRVEWVNEGFTRITGYTLEDVVGRTPGSVLQGPETDPRTVAVMRRGIRAGAGFNVEVLNYARSGRAYWLDIEARPVFDVAGALTHFIAIQCDVTGRKRAERRTEALNRLLRCIHRALSQYLDDSNSRATYHDLAAGLLDLTDSRAVAIVTVGETGAEEVELLAAAGGDPEGLRPWIDRARAGGRFAIDAPGGVHHAGMPLFHGATLVGVVALAGRPGGYDAELTSYIEPLLTTCANLVEADRNDRRRRRAEEQIRLLYGRLERRLDRLSCLRLIDMAITSSLDLRVTLGVVLDHALAQLGVDAAAILLLDPIQQGLDCACRRGFRASDPSELAVRVGEGLSGAAVREHRTVAVADLAAEATALARPQLVDREGFVAYFAVPLLVKGQVKGVLEAYHRNRLDPEPEWLDFLETLAGQAAIAVDNASLFEHLQRSNSELTLAYDATIEGWSHALDLRDRETEGHSRRVTEMTLRLARAMGIDGPELVQVRRGALLHDIGKMGVPDAILQKPGPLTDAEWVVMRKHPDYARDMLSPIAFLRPALPIPYCHHEKWDGTGYPRGLAGDRIPLEARIFAAVDIWDALLSDRPYRKGWPPAQVYDHIRSLAGTHLDPAVVEAFLAILDADREKC